MARSMSQRTHTEKPVFVRADTKFRAAIELIRRNQDPIPTVADTVRQAVFEKAKQYAKPNGGHRNGK